MKLAEESLDRSQAQTWAKWAGIAIGLVVLVAGLTWLASKLVSTPSAPKRQVAKISILPDTPPPPPPPKEEPKKEPPKAEAKPAPQDQPKPQQAPPPQQAEPLKMEGAAGEGPSAFAAGTVKQDYQGGAVNTGPASAPHTAVDRANERLYASTARQLLRDEIERQLRADAGQLTATFAVWVAGDGRIQRCEVQPSGDAAGDTAMQAALDGVAKSLRLPPPPSLQQPMRFRLTVRAQG